MKNKWFKFEQNNSGGHFTVNDKLCHRLFIEAKDSTEACDIAESMGVYFDGVASGLDCECCGDRWSRPDEVILPVKWEKSITLKTIRSYAQHLANEYGFTTPDSRLFYKSGRGVVEIFPNLKSCEKKAKRMLESAQELMNKIRKFKKS